jgi:hypothetical protein
MKQLINYIKTNKKVLLCIALIFALTVAVIIINNTNKSTVSTSSSAVEMSQTEKKLTDILSSIDGVGKTEVMIYESDDKISGVVIVCKGGNNIMTRSDILNAVSTALNIEKNIIAIYAMN